MGFISPVPQGGARPRESIHLPLKRLNSLFRISLLLLVGSLAGCSPTINLATPDP